MHRLPSAQKYILSVASVREHDMLVAGGLRAIVVLNKELDL